MPTGAAHSYLGGPPPPAVMGCVANVLVVVCWVLWWCSFASCSACLGFGFGLYGMACVGAECLEVVECVSAALCSVGGVVCVEVAFALATYVSAALACPVVASEAGLL